MSKSKEMLQASAHFIVSCAFYIANDDGKSFRRRDNIYSIADAKWDCANRLVIAGIAIKRVHVATRALPFKSDPLQLSLDLEDQNFCRTMDPTQYFHFGLYRNKLRPPHSIEVYAISKGKREKRFLVFF